MGSACQWNAAAGTRTSERGRGRLAVGAGLQRLGVGSLARGPRSGLRGVLTWGDWSAGPGCREAEGESAAREQAGVGGSSAGVAKRAGRKSLALRERTLGRARGEAGLRGELGRVELSISLFLFLFTLSLIKSNSNKG